MSDPRRFYLQRDTDVTGASGTGRVANGVQFPDGTVAVRWCVDTNSTVVWDSVDDAVRVHGHDGATRLVWLDPPSPQPAADWATGWQELRAYISAAAVDGRQLDAHSVAVYMDRWVQQARNRIEQGDDTPGGGPQ